MSVFERRRFLGRVKDAFDNLPSGICFFRPNGILVLCNRQMHRLAFALLGRDIQDMTKLTQALERPPGEGAVRERDALTLPDGSAWHFTRRAVTDGEGRDYIQFVASDVTELHRAAVELERKNGQLSQVAADLERINRNMAAITREEEILSMKMRIHNELGGSVLDLRRYYLSGGSGAGKAELVARWRRTLARLTGEIGQSDDTDALGELLETAEAIGVGIELDGDLPEDPFSALLLVCAMRECLTNAIRHAGGSRLLVALKNDGRTVRATITNDGERPAAPIAEGGGLGALRVRIEKAGGTMSVRSLPDFALTVTVPLKGDAYL